MKRKQKSNQRKNLGLYLFSLDKPPYLLIVILAIIGFQLKYLVADIQESPIIEYKWKIDSTRIASTKFEHFTTCKISNISRCKVISDVNFEVSMPMEVDYRSYKILNANVKAIPPATPVGYDKIDINKIFYFTISNFQPESSYILNLSVLSNEDEIELPDFYIVSSDPYLLLKENRYSRMVRNQFRLNIGILLLIIVVGLIYMIFYLKYINNETNKTNVNT